jgi:integrase
MRSPTAAHDTTRCSNIALNLSRSRSPADRIISTGNTGSHRRDARATTPFLCTRRNSAQLGLDRRGGSAPRSARWNKPDHRLITLILMRCGLRITDGVRLPRDCVVRDADGAPYLRYFNHKMDREALVPIDEELEHAIADQHRRVQARWPQGTPVLFPQSKDNPDGSRPMGDSTYRRSLYRWLKRCDIRDEHGQPARIVPHRFRHSLGTQLINRDVPQEVVRRILDHDSHMMTARYARLSDTTIRRHWERARKVNIKGETVALDPSGPLAEAAWAKQRVSQATQGPAQRLLRAGLAARSPPPTRGTPTLHSSHRSSSPALGTSYARSGWRGRGAGGVATSPTRPRPTSAPETGEHPGSR